MFSPEQRDRLREQIIAAARADRRVTGAAMTGSAALGGEDEWSDLDLFFGVDEAEDIAGAMADMTELMYREHRALHHFDVVAGPATYRVFLMDSTLQVDLAFAPESSFGAVAPSFRVLFGEAVERPPITSPAAMSLLDFGWLYALHARSSIERGKAWQAEYMLGMIRNQVIAAACLRHGLPAREGRGADRLPQSELQRFEGTLVRSLEPAELRRAMRSAIGSLLEEIALVDSGIAARIEPALKELAGVELSA